MAKKRSNEEIEQDAVDKLLTLAIFLLMGVALVCLLVYFEGTVTRWIFDHFHPMEE